MLRLYASAPASFRISIFVSQCPAYREKMTVRSHRKWRSRFIFRHKFQLAKRLRRQARPPTLPRNLAVSLDCLCTKAGSAGLTSSNS
jgi:hypothetical protein